MSLIKDNGLYVIAGPCSVESREQLQEVSEALCRLPQVAMIRCGVWKPRTRPGGFEGLGEPALQWMKEIADGPLRMAGGGRVRYCCEVARPEHVELCRRYGIEDVWVGARTTGSPFMVEELCEALRGSGMRVMVKNPTSPDLRLWIGAIERLQQAGISQIAAIHRGFSMYDNHGFRNMPLWELPLELRRQMPDLPLLCDPSHIGGRRELIAPLCYAARQLDYDGIVVEVHPRPAEAWTDAAQQITPDELRTLIESLPRMDDHDTSPQLEMMRQQIDELDHEMVRLLAERMKISAHIAEVKRQRGMTVYQPKRWEEVLRDRLQLARGQGLDEDFIREILEKIHGESVRVQMKMEK